MNNKKRFAPPRVFWEAVLQIHNHYFGPNLREYMLLPFEQQSGHIFRSLQVLDCWLEVAMSEGVLNEPED